MESIADMPLNTEPSCTQYPVPAFGSDPTFQHIFLTASVEIEDVRFFLDDPAKPIQMKSMNYMNWLLHLGVSKCFTKWIVPLWSSTALRANARIVFGYDHSPIEELGTRTVSSYIRYLLFTRGWSQDRVSDHLIEDFGYAYNKARPMIRRFMRSEAKERKFHKTQNEAALFSGVIVMGVRTGSLS